MHLGVILVDFANVFYGCDDSLSLIKSKIEVLIGESLVVSSEVDYVIVRLYGGWKSNSEYTHRASTVLGLLETINSELFPIVNRIKRIDGYVELAISQYNLEIEWNNTFQEKNARHFLNVRSDTNRNCISNAERCPIHLIAKATKGYSVPCPNEGCDCIDISQLVRMEQKMVDSMMTCDILEYVHDKSCDLIEVVSDDIDLHPALALAGEKYARENEVILLLMVKNNQNSLQYKTLLEPHNVLIKTWQ